MPLTELQKASFRPHIHSTDQLYDAETGDIFDPEEAGANLASGKVKLTGGNQSATASFADITGASITITTGARRCAVKVAGVFATTSANTYTTFFDITVDGTSLGGTDGVYSVSTTETGFNIPISISMDTDVLTAASHTFKVRVFSNNAIASTVLMNSANPLVFSVVEQYAGA